VVWHQHAVISNVSVSLDGPRKIDIAIIREALCNEVVAVPLDISEVDIEDLLTFSEPANYVKDLPSGIVQHFTHSHLEKIEAMVWTLM
jgi:hypothetical protein